MNYNVLILRRAQKELAALPRGLYERIRDALLSLANEPRPQGCTKFTAREGWRIRVGDYRVIYEIDDAGRKIIILHIGNRRDVYR